MQFTQPGFVNYGQPVFNPPFQFNGYPEVIGEGNVTSAMSPDGSMQLLFLPTTQWWNPYPCNINAGNANRNWNPTGVWFIRSVFSPLQPMPCQPQPFQCPSSVTLPRDYCESMPSCRPPSFELKFHNDICTSTSDIHYFYPNLKSCDWLKSIKSPSIQVAVPMATNNEYTKSCNYAPMAATENTAKVKCYAKTSNSSLSDMSCDTDKSEKHCYCHKGKKSRKEKKKLKSKKKNKVACDCHEQNTTEKGVCTYVDQACGGVAEEGRETQTTPGKGHETQTTPGKGHETQTECGTIPIIPVCEISSGNTRRNEIKTARELWMPKTPQSKKSMKTESSLNFQGTCESTCCSGSCSCHSETE